MKLVIFGLTISSSWGNGHATLWRGLTRNLAKLGVDVVFFERDFAFYAGARDCDHVPGGGELVLYRDWQEARALAQVHLREADAAIVTSFCPDGVAATDEIRASRCPRKIFYDLDTPVTLDNLATGRECAAIGPDGLRGFDLVLSFTGGPALDVLRRELGARRVAPLYGHVDPHVHRPMPKDPHFRSDLSYLGTYAQDRQEMLEQLFIIPARQRQDLRFVIGGAQYPADFPWTQNIYFVRHLPPSDHAAFFSSGRITLNVTRAAMARMGWCPSGRLFEAAACGAPILSDHWPGLRDFFAPGEEIIVAHNSAQSLAALMLTDAELRRIALRARERVLDEHTSAQRASELVALIDSLHAHAPSMET